MIKYRSLKHYKYQLMANYKCLLPMSFDKPFGTQWITIYTNAIEIEDGYCWDGPSGPTIDTKNFMRASLVHDALYQLMREGLLPESFRKDADQLLYDQCREDGMSRFRAWYVYQSVRLFAGKYARPK